MTLRIHTLLHVDFEDLGFIAKWAEQRGHPVSYTRFYNDEPLPNLNNSTADMAHTANNTDDFDWLIVMGGPMSIHDEDEFGWLKAEKRFIKQCIDAGKTVIGICLGSQLIAHVLGAEVKPSGIKEIGWLPIRLTTAGQNHPILQDLPKQDQEFTVFHWHGDGFTIPKGATTIAESDAWANQGFIYQTAPQKAKNNWTLAWQCHFEVTQNSMNNMLIHGKTEIDTANQLYPNTIQTVDNIKELADKYIANNNKMLAGMLDIMAII